MTVFGGVEGESNVFDWLKMSSRPTSPPKPELNQTNSI